MWVGRVSVAIGDLLLKKKKSKKRKGQGMREVLDLNTEDLNKFVATV